MHTVYTPAAAPAFSTPSAIDDDDTYVDVTVIPELLEQFPDIDSTNAPASPLTFTRPAPLTTTPTLAPAAATGITLGDTDATDTILNDPASTYGDVGVKRTHNSYVPAGAPLAFSVTFIADPYPLTTALVFATLAGLAAFGTEHDAATTTAPPSPLTSGNHDPVIFTL